MSEVRCFVEKAHTFFITRSTNLLQNRLRPGEETNNNFVYHLAYELGRQDITPCILLVLPGQYFLIGFTEDHSDIAKFARNFHSIVARDFNKAQGQSNALWGSKSFFYQAILKYRELVKRAAKVLTQAVRKGYVTQMDLWRGIQMRPGQPGGDRATATKPEFCGSRNTKPQTIELVVSDSPLFAHFGKTPEEFRQDVAELVDLELQELESHDQLADVEPMTCEEQFAIEPLDFAMPVPQVTTRNDVALLDLLENDPAYIAHNQRVRAFRRAYRHAFEAWQQATDKNSINFPIGTYKMRVIHNVQCTAPYALE